MEVINNLPVILAALTAFLAGLYGYMNNMPNIRIYQNMCLFLVVFYIIGMLTKRTLTGIWEDIKAKTGEPPENERLSLHGSLAGSAGVLNDPGGLYDADNAERLPETGGVESEVGEVGEASETGGGYSDGNGAVYADASADGGAAPDGGATPDGSATPGEGAAYVGAGADNAADENAAAAEFPVSGYGNSNETVHNNV